MPYDPIGHSSASARVWKATSPPVSGMTAPPPVVEDDAEDLARYVQLFEEAEEATNNERELSERDRDYYDNKQLTSAEKAALAKRGQPAIVINRIKRKI